MTSVGPADMYLAEEATPYPEVVLVELDGALYHVGPGVGKELIETPLGETMLLPRVNLPRIRVRRSGTGYAVTLPAERLFYRPERAAILRRSGTYREIVLARVIPYVFDPVKL